MSMECVLLHMFDLDVAIALNLGSDHRAATCKPQFSKTKHRQHTRRWKPTSPDKCQNFAQKIGSKQSPKEMQCFRAKVVTNEERFRKGNSATIYWRNGAVENKKIQENKSEKHCEKIPMGNAVGNQR